MFDKSMSPVFFTDFYNLTMSYAYWKKGLHETRAVFHFNFRRNPFGGGFIICTGLESVIKAIVNVDSISKHDLEFLLQKKDSNGNCIFSSQFVEYLSKIDFRDCDIHAVKEGTVIFPFEPVIRVEGPIIKCQMLETLFLNVVGFQSLISTKAARVCMAAGDDEVVELGMRHAHGTDGALSASKAAFIGGCHGTSNVEAGKNFGIPVKGTQSHSWIMFFDNELEAFREYSDVFNDNAFLVDTYSTVNGVKNAIKLGKELKKNGKKLASIRLDSGDLSDLSIKSRKLLDAAGFKNTRIVVSNELDEHIITSIKQEGCAIDVWGVGTKLVTGDETAAASCVYKLSALKMNDNKDWQLKMKLSEQTTKMSIPGIQQVKRFYDPDQRVYLYDMIVNELTDKENSSGMVLMHSKNAISIDKNLEVEHLLQPIILGGKQVYKFPNIKQSRDFVKQELEKLPTALKRFVNPDYYTIGIETNFYKEYVDLIHNLRKSNNHG